MRNGWYKESFRHSLAARGISTSKYQKYYQKKKTSKFKEIGPPDFRELPVPSQVSPVTGRDGGRGLSPGRAARTIREERVLEQEAAKKTKADRPVSRILEQVEANRFSSANAVLKDPSKLGISDEVERAQAVEAIQAALNAKAVSLASSGVPLSKALEDSLDPNFIADIRNVQSAVKKQEDLDREGPLKTLFKETVPGAIGSALETPFVGLREAAKAGENPELQQSLLSNIDNEVPRGAGEIDTDLADNPFRTTNVLVGNEEDGQLSVLQEPIPKLSNNFNFADGASAGNPVLQSAKERGVTAADLVDKQVQELYDAKSVLAKTDLKPFDEGTKAFQNGDREGLIRSINELQREEQKLRDRFTLVNVTGDSVVSRPNHDAAFDKKSDNFLMNVMGNGGDRIAEQTRKINEVRENILNANNQVFARRRQLEFRLKRLDASIPPETDIPSEVTRFKKGTSFGNPVLNTQNETLLALRGQQ